MSRIQSVAPRGLFMRTTFRLMRRMLGRVPTPMQVTARHPAIFRGQAAMER